MLYSRIYNSQQQYKSFNCIIPDVTLTDTKDCHPGQLFLLITSKFSLTSCIIFNLVSSAEKGNSNKKVNKYKAKSWKQVPGSLMKEAIRSYQFSCHRQIIRHTTLTNIPVIQPHTPLTLSLAQGNIIHHFASSKISILTKFKPNLACICQLFEQYSDICETNHKWTQFYDSISSPIRQKGETVSN